jgi:dTDP-4-amino-4,6-dideoxygalactose transaminase
VIPFVDLKAQYASIKDEVAVAIQGVLDSCQFTLGSEVAALEKEFAAYSGAGDAIGVNSGTSALHLALLAAGIGPGDEVITVPFTFVATAAAIHYAGATPVYVDIDPQTFTMDPMKLEAAVTARTRAVIPVHLYGLPADMDAIVEVARRHNLIVIEDAAQAHGAEYKKRRVGSLGDMACFSFYPGKNLGAYGEAGMVTTDNPGYSKQIRMLRDWGAEQKYHHVLKGYNFRMEGIQGAVLRVKMRHIEKWTEARRAAARYYDQAFAGSGIQTPAWSDANRHVYHVYAIRSPERAKWQQELTSKGVQTGIHYPIPVHLQPAYADARWRRGDFPHSEKASDEVLSLPMYPELTRIQQDEVVAAVLDLDTAKQLVQIR